MAIKATPTEGLCYNPSDPRYWDADGLAKEIERVFDICHGCRLCFNLCPSFPALFRAVDAHDGDVRALTENEIEAVVDDCYQCKLCYVKCPYTADDGHEFDLDFPRLMLRYTAQRARRRGIKLRDRMLGDPQRLGALARWAPGVVNRVNRARPVRLVMEKVGGIHRDKKLPEFAKETFRRWVERRGTNGGPADPAGEVVLFHTCFVDLNEPEIGKDAVEVLEHCGLRVLSPEQVCCGMPALESGNVEDARRRARRNVLALKPFVEAGVPVLAVNPTCSYMLKKEYAELVGDDLAADAKALAAATRDLCEYLFELKREDRLPRDFRSTPGEIAYHVPCHLKAQNIGFRSRDVMKTIPGVRVRLIERCCGHDGTWAMKREHFEASMEIGRPAFEEISAGGLMATDCPLAAVHFEQATGVRPLHPIQVLARAYRNGGFPDAVPAAEGGS
ncbi:MAG: anaerobic glycerol-3-phosphate dehydrogenase subunit C [Candidatus Dadabacteria bacterium]|nr:MAG: anaerobic glycerol-3-phosphate dehydrogenase subunit C [Candidatus Dadabacteria bacterium]